MILVFVCIGASTGTWAQTPTDQDCLGAIGVCDWVYSSPTLHTGSGNIPNEINSSISCLGQGETNSIWYTFTTQTAGDVNFTITPTNPAIDLDWAVFNLSTASCSEIFTNPALLVACNFNPVPGPTGANGTVGPTFNPVIPVLEGQIYAVVITAFQPGNQASGYTLDFSASTAQIFDNVAPDFSSIGQPIRCNTDTLRVFFNENVNCNQVTPASFILTGPDGAHTVNAVFNSDCNSGASYSSSYRITFSPPLTVNGQYTLTLGSGVSDLCGNTQLPATATPLLFDYAGLILDSTFSTMADCLQNNGSAGISITGGALPLVYSWTPGGQNTAVANNLYAGTYTVTVTDQNNCQITENVTVSNPVNFAVSFAQIPDTCSKGNGTITVNANGTSGPFQYQWNLPGNPTQQTISPVSGGDTLSVTVTDVDNCVINQTVIIQNLLNDSLVASFTATPNPVDILFPVTKLLNTSENYATYTWNIMGQTVTNNMNPVVELPDWGDYPVTLIVFDQNGCSDTVTDKILVRGDLYYFIPNAFTPTEDFINDTWYPRGVGFDKKSYQMTIFDRWENIVYMSGDTQQGWNGNDHKGQPCPAGIYGYKITMEGYEGKLPVFLGSLLLIR